MKYLPPPWRVLRTGRPSKKVYAGKELVATVRCVPQANTGDGLSPTYAKGNAYLIAAAPEMLDFVKRHAKEGDEEALLIMRTFRLWDLKV